MTATRQEVYAAIDSERAYQDARWNAETTASGGAHEPEAFLLYVEHYVGLARTALSTNSVQVAYPQAQEIFRKIAALAVAEMEQHGAPRRDLGLAASLTSACVSYDPPTYDMAGKIRHED